MTNEELREIEERHERNMQDIEKYGPVAGHERQLLADRAALLAGYKELKAEVERLTGEAAHKRLDDIEEKERTND